MLRRYFHAFLHLFYPHTCAGCGSDVLPQDAPVCASCFGQLPVTGFASFADNPIERLFYGRLNIEAAASLFYFTRKSAVQRILFQLKYQNHPQTGIWVGRLLGHALNTSGRFSHITAIVPVPLHHRKKKQRGYNQSQQIAEGIAAVCRWPVLNQAITREVFTATQTHMNRENRFLNLQQVFTADAAALAGHTHILLIDDVITTGATLEACALALQKAANVNISIATVACTLRS